MKHELPRGAADPSARKHFKRVADLKARANGEQVKRRKNQITMWRAFMIGGFAVLAVFACLEGLKPAPPAPPEQEAAEVEAPMDRPVAAQLAKVSPESADSTIPEVAATQDEGIAPMPVPIIPATEETATREPSDAERIGAEEPLLIAGIDSLRDKTTQRDRDMLDLAIHSGAWDAYRGLLSKSLKPALTGLSQGQGLNRFDPVWDEAALYQALLRWKTLGCFSESEISSRVTDSYSSGFLRWLLNNNEAMEELLLTIRPEDDSDGVLKFLMDAWAVNEADYQKYFPLALACAVVFDQPMSIAHQVGNTEYGVESMVEPLKRYLWYVEKNNEGKLAAPVHHSSARDLVWTVCAPVTTSELEWSLDKMHYRRKNWGNAYGKIEYLMERAVDGLNPYEEYSFAEILKEGGICGDQSYFCVNTARAQGIPAMVLSGETDLGGHAWAGLKIDSREWTTGVGRIGGVSKGQAGNPQTGSSITEQEIQLWNDRYHQSPTVTLSVWRHLWLADFFESLNSDDDHADTIRLASRLGHSFTEAWLALYSLLEREMELTGEPVKPSNLDDWKAFAKDMRREFKDNPRMAELAANAELEYIFPYGSDGDAKRMLLRERRRIERNSGEQKDLIAGSLKREAALIMKRGGPNAKRDISRLYDRALRDYGGSITGFKMMANDYFSYFRGDAELGRKAARDIELAFKRVVETGTKNWFRSNTESSIYKMICEFYRDAGDPDRAAMLEKRYQVLLRRAKRSAL